MFSNEKCSDNKGHLKHMRTHRGRHSNRGKVPPASVGTEIQLHYFLRSADSSYSPRYVRSVVSLTSALMLFNMAHSLVRTGVDTCCTILLLSLSVSFALKCILPHLRSCCPFSSSFNADLSVVSLLHWKLVVLTFSNEYPAEMANILVVLPNLLQIIGKKKPCKAKYINWSARMVALMHVLL